ncbi:MAG: MerR family transcriptional regulator [Bacilli bacterium]
MYSMKEVCLKVNMSYQTLKYYCNEGLIPNVKRDTNNYRVFDEDDIAWIEGLKCLKKCGMSIKEMKTYMELCLIGKDSINERKIMLAKKKKDLLNNKKEIQKSIDFIDKKQQYYDDVLLGKIEYKSNLIKKMMHLY